jgi:hypothetical protein
VLGRRLHGHTGVSHQQPGFSTSSMSAESSVDHATVPYDSDSDMQPVEVKSWRTGKLVAVTAELQGRLAPIAERCGVTDIFRLARAVAPMYAVRLAGLLEHGEEVACYLQQLGIKQPQLARLLLRCPLLFSWPPAERAQQLFQELMGEGLPAVEAALCFERQPAAAQVRSFRAAINWMTQLLAGARSPKQQGLPARQPLAQLLRKQPSAIGLLLSRPVFCQLVWPSLSNWDLWSSNW